jgi:hypothetical protein
MKTVVKSVAILLSVALCGACTRSFEVYDVSKLKTAVTQTSSESARDPLAKDYLFYALPRTVLAVDVPITKAVTVAEGPCTGSKFDDMRTELLADEPKSSVGFKAAKPIVSTRSEADPAAVYAVDLRLRPFALTTGTFEMTDNGVLTTAAVTQEDQSIDAVLTVARLALTASGAIAVSTPAQPGKAPEEPADRKACRQTMEAIKDLRVKRLQMIGDSMKHEAPSESYLTTVLGKLDEIEESLLSAFVGQTKKTVATIHCEWRPAAFDAANGGKKLFLFSAMSGPEAIADSGCIIPQSLLVTPKEKPHVDAAIRKAGADSKVEVWTRVLRDDDGTQYADAVSKVRREVDANPRGFFYRIPASAVVSVDFGKDSRTREVKPVAQLGIITTLPTLGGAFVRKAGMTPTLNAAGGLQKLVLNGEPGGNAALTGAGDLYKAYLTEEAAEETRKSADRAAAAAAKDELTVLERQRKILEERQKIAEAEKKLAELAGEGSQP